MTGEGCEPWSSHERKEFYPIESVEHPNGATSFSVARALWD